jgi:ArsR family transcriptional regulator
MNISDYSTNYEKLADVFSLLAQPSRLQILQLIGDREICVCHLKAALGYRQAYISQQLMGLRQAGYVKTRRQGRSIYYSLVDPNLTKIINLTANELGISLQLPAANDVPGCAILPALAQSLP